MVSPLSPLDFSNKIVLDHPCHPNPHSIVEVQLVKPLLILPPLPPAVVDDLPVVPILIPQLVSPGAQEIDVGHIGNAIWGVELLNLQVQCLDLLRLVGIAEGRARGRVFPVPGKPGWQQERGHSKLVWSTCMILVILVPTLQDVVQA